MTSRDAQRIISLEDGWANNIKPNAINVLEDHLNRVSGAAAVVVASGAPCGPAASVCCWQLIVVVGVVAVTGRINSSVFLARSMLAKRDSCLMD